MSTFVLVPGAGGVAWYWHRLVPELERLGHKAIAVDIREDDPGLGLQDYADIVVAAAGDHRDGSSWASPWVPSRSRLSRPGCW